MQELIQNFMNSSEYSDIIKEYNPFLITNLTIPEVKVSIIFVFINPRTNKKREYISLHSSEYKIIIEFIEVNRLLSRRFCGLLNFYPLSFDTVLYKDIKYESFINFLFSKKRKYLTMNYLNFYESYVYDLISYLNNTQYLFLKDKNYPLLYLYYTMYSKKDLQPELLKKLQNFSFKDNDVLKLFDEIVFFNSQIQLDLIDEKYNEDKLILRSFQECE